MVAKHHSQLTDSHFEKAFENLTLDPVLFSHEAHLRLAYIHINKYGLSAAKFNLCRQIQAYAQSLGAHRKFNKTVTIAATLAIHHFMTRSKSNTFEGLINEFPRLNTHFIELLKTHYSFDLFKNEKAKTSYLQPDLVPF